MTGQISEMLSTAQTVYERSGGALDLTVYPLVKAWGFIDSQYRVPSDSEIESLMKNVDFSQVSFTSLSDSDGYVVSMRTGLSSPLPAWPRAVRPSTRPRPWLPRA